MGKLCVSDPQKMSHVCSQGNQITVSLSSRGQRHFKKAQKAYEQKSTMLPNEREKFSQLMKSSINAQLSLTSNDVKSAVCVSNPEGYDQLVILHPNIAIINQKFYNPLLPIAIKKGGCDKLVNKSFLKDKMEPKEVFVNTAKNEIADLRQHL